MKLRAQISRDIVWKQIDLTCLAVALGFSPTNEMDR